MFGLASGAGVFGSIADMLVAIYVKSSFGPLLKWVDHFFAIKLPESTWTEQEFIDLTASIGVPWSAEKLRRLAAIQRYIGFDWDLARKLVALPKEKLDRTLQLIDDWCKASTRTSSQAASAHPMSQSCFGPTRKPSAHFHTAQWVPMTIPTPKDELASPHQPMSMGSGAYSNLSLGDCCNINFTHERSAIKAGGGMSFARCDLNPWENPDMACRNGLISGICKICVPVCHAALPSQ
jgi:hypothetical protein